MSDVLLAKLRVDDNPLCNEAANQIEALSREIAELRDRLGIRRAEMKALLTECMRISILLQDMAS